MINLLPSTSTGTWYEVPGTRYRILFYLMNETYLQLLPYIVILRKKGYWRKYPYNTSESTITGTTVKYTQDVEREIFDNLFFFFFKKKTCFVHE